MILNMVYGFQSFLLPGHFHHFNLPFFPFNVSCATAEKKMKAVVFRELHENDLQKVEKYITKYEV